MSTCYLTGNTILEKNAPNHDDHKSVEHIIPNALGGKLTSSYVLTSKSNLRLNEEIDKDFNKIFASFATKLDIQKDRKTSPSFNAFNMKYETDVFFKDGRYFPRKPVYDSEKKTIYADSINTGNNYKKYLIKNGEVSSEDELIIMDDLAGELRIPFGLGNNTFKKGIAKIAAGFATLKGISRSDLKNVIDIENNKFIDKLMVIPYIPISENEIVFEKNIHKSPYFPIHSLVLYGQKQSQILYCYVELFSAFQFYIILDENYCGDDIYESYIYSILASEEITYNDYINSMSEFPHMSEKLIDFRKTSTTNLIKLTRVGQQTFKEYCHSNFHTLSAFTNYKFISSKAKRLGLINS